MSLEPIDELHDALLELQAWLDYQQHLGLDELPLNRTREQLWRAGAESARGAGGFGAGTASTGGVGVGSAAARPSFSERVSERGLPARGEGASGRPAPALGASPVSPTAAPLAAPAGAPAPGPAPAPTVSPLTSLSAAGGASRNSGDGGRLGPGRDFFAGLGEFFSTPQPSAPAPRTEPARTEPARTEPARAESARQEPVRPELRVEPVRTESRPESQRSEPPSPLRREPVREPLRTTERPSERPSERSPERSTERATGRPVERSPVERSPVERGNERTPERGFERPPERLQVRGAEPPSERPVARPERSVPPVRPERPGDESLVPPEVEENPNQVGLFAGMQRVRPSGVQEYAHPFAGPPPANKARALQALQDDVGECVRCSLSNSRARLVYGQGNVDASILFVGDAPGQAEEQANSPLVGEAGKLFDRILETMLKCRREDIYLINSVLCSPPPRQSPGLAQLQACQPILERVIEIVRPRFIVTLGPVALKALFVTPDALARMRGFFWRYRGIEVMPTFHPTSLLQDSSQKRPVKEDMEALVARLAAIRS